MTGPGSQPEFEALLTDIVPLKLWFCLKKLSKGLLIL